MMPAALDLICAHAVSGGGCRADAPCMGSPWHALELRSRPPFGIAALWPFSVPAA